MTSLSHWPEIAPSISITDDTILVVGVDLAASPQRLEQCHGWLSDDERHRATRFQQELHRQRFIVAHGALRDVLSRCMNREPQQLIFKASEHGKPAIVDPAARIIPSFSLTHSRNMALIAVTAHRDVGIDIEYHRPGVAMTELARRFFAPDEAAIIADLNPSAQTQVFFDCWSRKEAVVKTLGTGLLTPLHRFSVDLKQYLPLNRFHCPPEWPVISLMSLDLPDNWSGALAAVGQDWSVTYRRLASD